MFLENVFPPIPPDVVLPLAGGLTVSGQFNLFWIKVIGMLALLTGAFAFYGLGRWIGEQRVRMLITRFGKYAILGMDDFDKSPA